MNHSVAVPTLRGIFSMKCSAYACSGLRLSSAMLIDWTIMPRLNSAKPHSSYKISFPPIYPFKIRRSTFKSPIFFLSFDSSQHEMQPIWQSLSILLLLQASSLTPVLAKEANEINGPYYYSYCTADSGEAVNALKRPPSGAEPRPSNQKTLTAYFDCNTYIQKLQRGGSADPNPCNPALSETWWFFWIAKDCSHTDAYWDDVANGGDPFLLTSPNTYGWDGRSAGVKAVPYKS